MPAPLILLDADGVLVDYLEGYAMAWEQAFGHRPAIRDPQGHFPTQYWDVPTLDEPARTHLQSHGFTQTVWSSMPALAGAVEACQQLQDAGFTLACVTALRPEMQPSRVANLRALGFRLEDVFAVGNSAGANPKAPTLRQLAPMAFVDDHLPFLQELDDLTWRALIDVRPNGSPNAREDLEPPHSRHASLLTFTEFWLPRFMLGRRRFR